VEGESGVGEKILRGKGEVDLRALENTNLPPVRTVRACRWVGAKGGDILGLRATQGIQRET